MQLHQRHPKRHPTGTAVGAANAAEPAKPPDREAEAEHGNRVLDAANILEHDYSAQKLQHQNFADIVCSKGKDFAASMRKHYHASDHSKTNGP